MFINCEQRRETTFVAVLWIKNWLKKMSIKVFATLKSHEILLISSQIKLNYVHIKHSHIDCNSIPYLFKCLFNPSAFCGFRVMLKPYYMLSDIVLVKRLKTSSLFCGFVRCILMPFYEYFWVLVLRWTWATISRWCKLLSNICTQWSQHLKMSVEPKGVFCHAELVSTIQLQNFIHEMT